MGADSSKAARSVIWSAVENGGLAAVSFGSLVVYARFLTPSDFGLFSVVLATVDLLTVVVTMLFHDALVQRQHVTERHFNTAFTVSLGLGVVMLAVCASLAPLLARLLGNPTASPLLAVMALSFPLAALSSSIAAYHRRELEFKALAVRSLAGRLVGAAAGIVLVIRGAGAWGLVAQQLVTAAAGTIVLWATTNRRPRLAFGRTELGQLLGFGGYAITTLLTGFAITRIFTIVAGILLGTTAAGVLNLGFRVVDVFWAIAATAINQVALPVLAPLRFTPERLARAYRTAVSFSSLMLFPCFVGLAVVAREVVQLLFGARWLSVVPYIAALSFTVVFRVPRQLSRAALTAVGRPQDDLVGYGVEIVVLVAGILLLRGQATGPTVMGLWIVREVAAAPVMAWVVGRTAGLSVRDLFSGALAALVSSALMGVAVYAVGRVLPLQWPALARLAVLIPCGVATFAGAAVVFNRASLARIREFLVSARRPSSLAAIDDENVTVAP